MRAVIIGSNGQLGTDLVQSGKELSGFEIVPHTRSECDITNSESVIEYLSSISPDIIINTAAYHKTDECEDNPSLSFDVNATAVKVLSEFSNMTGAVLCHISTDYVFGGSENRKDPYTESSNACPINTYGISKLAGEEFLKSYCEKQYLFRISSVFGKAGASGKGTNFVYTMLNLAKERDELTIIDDIVMTPTYTVDAAKKIWEIVDQNFEFGTYHVANSGRCTWHEFADEIFKSANIDVKLKPVTHLEYPTKAKRPLWSPISSEKGTENRPWQEAIAEFVGSL
ncbi:MAG: dTDP-4-dehydrorhamnose reductase [Euryarchaeota archaeon]|nr:dTDP-4-dehydrorhamnose reductase [Euryarchaeota archaeon]